MIRKRGVHTPHPGPEWAGLPGPGLTLGVPIAFPPGTSPNGGRSVC